jgi:chaperone BCS1
MQWLARHPSFSFQQLSIMTSNVTIHANEETTSNHIFAPCPNVAHYLSHHGWPIVVHRKRQVERASGQDVLETLEMYTIGRSPKIMQEIVAEAKSQAVERDSDRTVIYHNTGGRWSRQQEARSRRPIGSVVLDGGMRQALVSDVRQFLDSSSYYTRLGVPYRRGYLMHGPPGCGKSSFVTALAGEMRLAICVLSLSNRSLDDESLNNLLNTAPLRSIVLLEDIDRAFTSDSRVTMSGLLNALDGVAAQEGRIVFMTTNHVDRLDPALIRPGRADVKVEIGLLAKAQAVELFRKFFPEAPETIVKDFEATIPDRTVSPAQLQSHLFLHRNSAQEAVYTLESFVEELRAFDAKVRAEQERANRARNFRPPPML